MVAGLNAGKLMVVAALLLSATVAPLAWASVESGRKYFTAYQEALQAQQAALGAGDGATYESKGSEAEERLRDARAAFEAAGAQDSSDAAILRDYVAVLRAMNYDDLAAETIEAAIARGIEDGTLWRLLGECLLTIAPGRFPDAVEALRHSLELDDTSPASADTWFALGHYYLKSELPEEASRCFDSALTARPDHVASRLGSAASMVYRGEVASAGEIIEAVGREAQAYDVMLRSLMRAALYDFDNARRTLEDTAVNHYAYARLLYLAARLPEAILAANRATDLDPANTAIWNFLGAIQLQSGDYAGAQAAYEGSLRANPNQTDVAQTIEQIKQAQSEAAKQQQQQQAPLQGQGPLR